MWNTTGNYRLPYCEQAEWRSCEVYPLFTRWCIMYILSKEIKSCLSYSWQQKWKHGHQGVGVDVKLKYIMPSQYFIETKQPPNVRYTQIYAEKWYFCVDCMHTNIVVVGGRAWWNIFRLTIILSQSNILSAVDQQDCWLSRVFSTI